MHLQFACAFVRRMQSHVRMLQPFSSGVMHAKPRGVHGTGRARQCRHEHASTQEMRARKRMARAVLPQAGRTSTLCSVDTSGARGRLRRISKAPVSADTLYRRSVADASLGVRIDAAQPLGSAGGAGHNAGILFQRFRFVNHTNIHKGRTLSGLLPSERPGAKSRVHSRNIIRASDSRVSSVRARGWGWLL